jgi:hypothetical protein
MQLNNPNTLRFLNLENKEFITNAKADQDGHFAFLSKHLEQYEGSRIN